MNTFLSKATLVNIPKKSYYRHPFHIVTPSPWPLLTSISIFCLVVSLVMYLHTYMYGGVFFFYNFIMFLLCLYGWFQDIIFEAYYEGRHTSFVQRGLRYGFVLFLISEAAFFASLFWAFFHSALAPTIWIQCVWPPVGIHVINAYGLPLLNTIYLLYSGYWATVAHKYFRLGVEAHYYRAIYALIFAIFFGILFTGCQLYEYIKAPFDITDSVYGSIFYLATGFHGVHVIIGTIFLISMFLRHLDKQFIGRHFFGVEAAIWYWHFVDVIWLFLYISIYIWGSDPRLFEVFSENTVIVQNKH
jgi:cytochrome c oxidase subunit 3